MWFSAGKFDTTSCQMEMTLRYSTGGFENVIADSASKDKSKSEKPDPKKLCL